MTTRYTGMNPDGTGNLNDMEHLKQSVRDILITPLASRVMRREYGSLVPDLIDEPMNNTTRLQCMSAAVIVPSLTRWEPRIALDAIDVVWKAGGRAGVTLSGTVMQTMQNVELTITLRE
ncbi:baseplate assembly protein [Escherichia coli]|uniref:Baseplate assembly protein n=1 Tax=Escherichia coli TaxID=562 RepID=A0A8S0FXU9_ECOLX|nr:baseplate assembly protein [Escherichia coli]